MASGLDYQEMRWFLFNGDDPLTTYYLDQRDISLTNTKIVDSPTEYFQYNKYHPQLLGMILERATGIDVLVDDTPQAILLSCFDPVRREIARLSVEKLIEDGRIHPARIEEVVEKTIQGFDEHLLEEGEAIAFELGITEVNPRLIRMLGRMRYCHSGGHNLLQHTRETVLLATNLA